MKPKIQLFLEQSDIFDVTDIDSSTDILEAIE